MTHRNGHARNCPIALVDNSFFHSLTPRRQLLKGPETRRQNPLAPFDRNCAGDAGSDESAPPREELTFTDSSSPQKNASTTDQVLAIGSPTPRYPFRLRPKGGMIKRSLPRT